MPLAALATRAALVGLAVVAAGLPMAVVTLRTSHGLSITPVATGLVPPRDAPCAAATEPGRIVVGWKPGAPEDERAAAHRTAGARAVEQAANPASELDATFVTLPAGTEEWAIALDRAHAGVRFAGVTARACTAEGPRPAAPPARMGAD